MTSAAAKLELQGGGLRNLCGYLPALLPMAHPAHRAN